MAHIILRCRYYSAIILVDLFRYSNHYTSVSGITDTAQYGEEEDEGVTDLRDECEAYVFNGNCTFVLPFPFSSYFHSHSSRLQIPCYLTLIVHCESTAEAEPTPFSTLLTLYSRLSPSLSLSTWMDDNNIDSLPVDVRRMIQFGIIKGFLRRVWCFPIWLNHPSLLAAHSNNDSGTTLNVNNERRGGAGEGIGGGGGLRPDLNRNLSSTSTGLSSTLSAATSSLLSTNSVSPRFHHLASGKKIANTTTSKMKQLYPASLPLMLDGSHCTDEICIKYGIGLGHLEMVLRSIGGVGEEEDSFQGDKEKAKEFGQVVLLYV
jgi:hypothetical protein